ncbi:hypothetical protein Tco_1466786 [Tanacetum coccineum]
MPRHDSWKHCGFNAKAMQTRLSKLATELMDKRGQYHGGKGQVWKTSGKVRKCQSNNIQKPEGHGSGQKPTCFESGVGALQKECPRLKNNKGITVVIKMGHDRASCESVYVAGNDGRQNPDNVVDGEGIHVDPAKIEALWIGFLLMHQSLALPEGVEAKFHLLLRRFEEGFGLCIDADGKIDFLCITTVEGF